MPDLRDFDELYVISDLHIGGKKDFQIFDQGELLKRLLERVRDRPAKKSVALVINGDTVDFLAESPFKYIDPEGAVEKLNRIAGDPAFKPVFEGLSGFVGKANRHLIVTLGNHDLELAFPWVRERFLGLLSDGNEAARGRITLAFEGSGYVCGVAGASVLCVHGNDFDPFNFTDYEKLREMGANHLQRRAVEDWTPNAGTKLVIDVMNEIKQTYPFVDLLKPEKEAMVPILAALAPGLRRKLENVWDVAKKVVWDQVKREIRGRFLGEADEDSRTPASVSLNQFLGQALPKTLSRPPAQAAASGASWTPSSEDALVEVEEDLERDPMDLLHDTEMAEQLGLPGAIWKRVTGAKTQEVLQEALEGLKEDRSFELDAGDTVFERSNASFGSNFDFVVTGHTHTEREIPLGGGGVYFNSGSWVATMRLTDEVLEKPDLFEQAFAALRDSRTLRALKKKKVGGKDLVLHFPGVVQIDGRGGGLLRVQTSDGKLVLDRVTKDSKLQELGEK